jgi:hypothetical protein
MSIVTAHDRQLADLKLPDQLQHRLVQFQHRVWWVKMAEAVLAGLVGLLASYLLVFLMDRAFNTPAWVRGTLLVVGTATASVLIPWHGYRWVWRSRRLRDVARIVGIKHPRVGDRLLGIVELTESHGDGQASAALCRAAIRQVADDTQNHDFLSSVPNPRHVYWRNWAVVAAGLTLVALCIPGAGLNALQRWAMPWRDIPRYTFAQLDSPPQELFVPIGEPFAVRLKLQSSSPWAPAAGRVRYGDQDAVRSSLKDGVYTFELPPQTAPATLAVRVGDATYRVPVEPKTRPELTEMFAKVKLPDYLQYPEQKKDVRGGSVTLLVGSQASFEATASRGLVNVSVRDSQPWVTRGNNTIASPTLAIDQALTQQIQWTDVVGLSAKEPFQLQIRTVEDQAPTLQCRNMPHEKVLLEDEVLNFTVSAGDDYGIKNVGLEWSGIEDPLRNPTPDRGEYLLAKGEPEKSQLEVQGAFSAKQAGIVPQPVHVRLYVEDFLPERGRIYSPEYLLYVLTPEQHMIWVTEQMQRWERQVLEVRDEEQRLFEQNAELAKLTPEELGDPKNRRKIAAQAAAERANGRRLEALNQTGEDLIALATRNDEFNVATLEKWAQMLQTLKNLAENRMPTVGNLLLEASQASAKPSAPPTAPQVIDQEEGMRRDEDPDKDKEENAGDQPPSKGSPGLGLATTTLSGPPSKSKGGACPVSEELEEALEEQEALLAEFNSVMDEISKILQDLQGSTFVKRLKHAAKQETALAKSLHERLPDAFGTQKDALADTDQSLLEQLRVQQFDTMRDLSLIQEDLQAYFQRTQEGKFQRVHEEMKDTRVVSNFKGMSDAVFDNQSGETIAEAEYWSDQLDRWAEILVGPGCKEGGT